MPLLGFSHPIPKPPSSHLTKAEEFWDQESQIPSQHTGARHPPSHHSNTNLSSSHHAYLTPYLTPNRLGFLTALGGGKRLIPGVAVEQRGRGGCWSTRPFSNTFSSSKVHPELTKRGGDQEHCPAEAASRHIPGNVTAPYSASTTLYSFCFFHSDWKRHCWSTTINPHINPHG